ncbi:Do family serine endopeptidase [Formicincola oecophyllae]|uniref:Do family serine endopeptidase n=2 Tax=Formicincola oecophyllae TaxID=2558361 RepID=A0A4Y6UA70_9PROT|nr:Do family serine endopeptidase [Formicincola oecophyllae]
MLAGAAMVAAPWSALAEPATSIASAPATVRAPQSVVAPANVKAHCNCLPDFVNIAKAARPAVVSLSVHMKADSDTMAGEMGPENPMGGMGMSPFMFPFPPFPGFPMGPMQGEPAHQTIEARGSGFLVSPDGYIVTNNHVVNGAERITVKLADGSILPGTLVGHDDKTDLALVRIHAGHALPWLELGDSDDVQPGQWVAAIGNPLGFGGTITAGIVSALGRDLHLGRYNDFIQVDAPINQGNSGGPLITLNGKVAGVNALIVSSNGGGSIGLGFAIPSNTVRTVVEQLKRTGHVVRGYLGVATQPVSGAIAQALGMPLAPGAMPKGALISMVVPSSPAAKAGLKSGDLILSINNHMVQSPHDLTVKVTALKPGSKAMLSVWRAGTHRDVAFEVGLPPNNHVDTEGSGKMKVGGQGKLGFGLAPLSALNRQQLGLNSSINGAVVAEVAPNSPAQHAGIQAGDVIISVGETPTPTLAAVVEGIQKALARHQPALLQIVRDHETLFVAVSPSSVQEDDPESGP